MHHFAVVKLQVLKLLGFSMTEICNVINNFLCFISVRNIILITSTIQFAEPMGCGQYQTVITLESLQDDKKYANCTVLCFINS